MKSTACLRKTISRRSGVSARSASASPGGAAAPANQPRPIIHLHWAPRGTGVRARGLRCEARSAKPTPGAAPVQTARGQAVAIVLAKQERIKTLRERGSPRAAWPQPACTGGLRRDLAFGARQARHAQRMAERGFRCSWRPVLSAAVPAVHRWYVACRPGCILGSQGRCAAREAGRDPARARADFVLPLSHRGERRRRDRADVRHQAGSRLPCCQRSRSPS